MDLQRVEASVLSVLGTFCWIEVQPPEASGPVSAGGAQHGHLVE